MKMPLVVLSFASPTEAIAHLKDLGEIKIYLMLEQPAANGADMVPLPIPPPPILTARERAVAELVAKGYSNKLVARQMNITEGTVKMNLCNIYRKLNLSSRTQLALAYLKKELPGEAV